MAADIRLLNSSHGSGDPFSGFRVQRTGGKTHGCCWFDRLYVLLVVSWLKSNHSTAKIICFAPSNVNQELQLPGEGMHLVATKGTLFGGLGFKGPEGNCKILWGSQKETDPGESLKPSVAPQVGSCEARDAAWFWLPTPFFRQDLTPRRDIQAGPRCWYFSLEPLAAL